MRNPPMRFTLFALSTLLTACQTQTPTTGGPSSNPWAAGTQLSAPVADRAAVAKHEELIEKNPPGLRFSIRLLDGLRYRQGQRIPVELSFASSIAKKFKLDGALYDRGGRLHIDEYRVSPETRDPLAEYYAMGFGGMGGLRMTPVLSEKPHLMVFDLNEWHRFDKLGHYTLYVTSKRVSWERTSLDGGTHHENQTVTSQNIVSFTVVPADAAWRSKTVNAAKRVLDDKAAKEEQRREAARTLRFLGTESAAREMIRRLGIDQFSHQFSFGLFSSPHRALLVREMEQSLTAPDFPVATTFLHTLTSLKTWQALPELPDAGDSRAWAPHHAKRRQVEDDLTARLADVLAKKHPAARAVSVVTLLAHSRSRAKSQGPPKWLAAAQKELPQVLNLLPHEELSRLLDYGFVPIAHLPLAKALKDLLAAKDLAPNLRQIALQRLYEIEPIEGRRQILQIIRRGQPQLGISPMATLGLLPDQSLPAVESDLAARLEKCGKHCHPTKLWLIGRLLHRYATSAIASRVRKIYEQKSEWGAREQAAFLAYFSRVDATYGKTALKAAVKQRGHRSAVHLLAKLVALQPSTEADRLLIVELENKHANLAAEAARALGRHGAARVQAALWQRLKRWSREWHGKQQQLRYPLIGKNPHAQQVQLERALWQAIATGRAWLTDLKGLRKLQRLLVTEQEKKQLGYKLGEWKHGTFAIRWHRQDDGTVRASVAQYDLDSLEALTAKLAQFPRGTRFEWRPHGEVKGDFETVERTVTKHGSKLTRP